MYAVVVKLRNRMENETRVERKKQGNFVFELYSAPYNRNRAMENQPSYI